MRAASAALLLGAAACGRSAAPPSSAVRRQTIEGLTLSQSDRGRPAWTLRSRLAQLREDQNDAALEAPVMDFYQDDRVASRVTARNGDIATDTHDVRLSSAVVLTSYQDHSVLTTDVLVYSSKAKRFRTDSDVVVRRPDGVVYGHGMEATPDLSEVRIFRQRSVLNGRPR